MDRHTQQTNDRLRCIEQQLNSAEGFEGAARELLEWCADERAFQAQYEAALFSCLGVVSRVAAQSGYDLDLGYRLLAVCATHREKLSLKSAAKLVEWSEGLGKVVLVRHQKMPSESTLNWGTGSAGGQQALSVVTTVWGVTQSTQTGPYNQPPNSFAYTNTTMSGAYTNTTMSGQLSHAPRGVPSGAPHQGHIPQPPQKAGYPPQHMGYNQQSMPPYNQRPNGYPPTPVSHGVPPNGPPPEALSAAALVAAAATATATATATAVMGMQEQQRQPPGGQPQMNMNMNVMGNQYQMGQGSHNPQQQPPPPQQQQNPTYGGAAAQYPQMGQGAPQHNPQQPQQQPGGYAAGQYSQGPSPGAQGQGHMRPAAMPMQQPSPAMGAQGMQHSNSIGGPPQQPPQNMGGPPQQHHGMGPQPHQNLPPPQQQGMPPQHPGMPPSVPPGMAAQNAAGGGVEGGPPPGHMPLSHISGVQNAGPPPMQRPMNNMGQTAMHGQMGPMHQMSAGKPGSMAPMYRRHTPYPNPQQVIANKHRGPQPYNNGQYAPQYQPYQKQGFPPSQQPHPSPNAYGGPMQRPPYGPHGGQFGQFGGQGQPGQPGGPPPPNMAAANHISQSGPMGPGGPQQPPAGFPGHHPNMYPPGMPRQAFSQPNYPNSGGMYPPHSPNLPPGHSMPPDVKPSLPDIKPPLSNATKPDELRLTFPVRDGVVLQPFRLEHNLAVSNHTFQLRDSVYQTLMWRSDLELQLKCFHHEDRQMNTNWPANVTVSVNATPLHIERGDGKGGSHKPLYLKEVGVSGRNTIQITVTACCCSHLFVLQLVHRPSVRSVLQGLLRKRLLPGEHCVTKIKRNFSSSVQNACNGPNSDGDGVEQTAIKVPLKCPISMRRISLPARGHDCKHIQCFDLESYLQMNCERGSWKCPVCNKNAMLEGLEIDQYIWGILYHLQNTEFEEVTIDQTASFKPVQIKSIIKEEPGRPGGCPGELNRWSKAISPTSMVLPTMATWEQPQGPAGPPHPSMNTGGPKTPGGICNSTPYSPPFPEDQKPSITPDILSTLSELGNNIEAGLQPLIKQESVGGNPPTPGQHQGPGTPGQATQSRAPDSNGGPGTPHSASAAGQPPTPQTQQPPATPGSTQPLSHGGGGASGNSNPNSTQSEHSQGTPGQAVSTTPAQDTQQDGGGLDFDPAAIIDGDTNGEGLDLLPASIGDLDIMAYLGSSDGTTDVPGGNTSTANSSDDLFSSLLDS